MEDHDEASFDESLSKIEKIADGERDVSRRNAIYAIAGALGAVSLARCAAPRNSEFDADAGVPFGGTEAALTGTSFQWVDTLPNFRALAAPGGAVVAVLLGRDFEADGGGGLFLWNATSTLADDGVFVVRPNSNPAMGRWIRMTPDPKAGVNVMWYGVDPNGNYDNAPAFQAAIDDAQWKGWAIEIPAGKFLLDSPLNITNPDATGAYGGRVCLRGQGMAQTVLIRTANDGGTGLVINSDWVNPSDDNEQNRSLFSGFTIEQQNLSKSGFGVSLDDVGYVRFQDVAVRGFNYGLYANDTLCAHFNRCLFEKNTRAIVATSSWGANPGTAPNAWQLDDCIVNGNVDLGIQFDKPAVLTINSGTFEGNGIGSMHTKPCAVYVNGNPSEGSTGLVIRGTYFEHNKGIADIYIDANDTDSASHLIEGCSFNRIHASEYVAHPVCLNKPSTGTGVTMVTVKSCGFRGLNSYTPNASRKYVDVDSSANGSYEFDLVGNYFASIDEAPTVGSRRYVASWVRFNGSSLAISQRCNVSSIARNGVGNYTINFSRPLVSSAHGISILCNEVGVHKLVSEGTGWVRVATYLISGSPLTLTPYDFTGISVTVIGETGGWA